MSITWQHLAGDTSDFAFKASLLTDPHAGAAATAEWSASWGSFEIWAGGRNLCAHSEQGEMLDAVHWYLWPLATWLVDSWDALLHEERLPNEVAAADAVRSLRETALSPTTPWSVQGETAGRVWSDWWQRHSLQAGRSGGLFPEVLIRRRGDEVELSWESFRVPGAPPDYAFLSPRGVHRTAVAAVADALISVLTELIVELERRVPNDAVAALRARLDGLEAGFHTRERVAWLAGLGADLDSMKRRWGDVERRLSGAGGQARHALLEPIAEPLYVRGAPSAAVLFGAVSPTVSTDDVELLTSLILSLQQPGAEGAESLDRVADWQAMERTLDHSQAPWRQGYDLAEEVAERLELPAEEKLDIYGLFERLGIDVEHVALTDNSVRGLAIVGPGHPATAVINDAYGFNSREEVRRFTVSHELCHLLFDRHRGRPLAVASGPWAPLDTEQRANAFAAYLLMPESFVQRVLGTYPGPVDSQEDLRAVAQELGTSVLATAWHLRNLGLIDRARAERLVTGAGQPVPE